MSRDPFKEMQEVFRKNINAHSVTAEYGCIGTEYLKVLCVQYGKIIVIGELLYRIFREGLYTDESLKAFAQECEKYRDGIRDSMPVWCNKENGLTFED